MAIFTYLKNYDYTIFTLNNATIFQKLLIDKLLKSTMQWYDTTPSGRIISKFLII